MANTYDDDDDIVTLLNADGEEVDFTEIAGINYGGKFYAILQPVELLEGMDDDEALVFRVKRGRDGEDTFEIETDDHIIDAVFAEYNRLIDEQQGSSAPSTPRRNTAPSRGNNKSRNSKNNKPVSKTMFYVPLVLTAICLVLAIVASFMNWSGTIVALAFLGMSACFIWFIVALVMYFIKKIKSGRSRK